MVLCVTELVDLKTARPRLQCTMVRSVSADTIFSRAKSYLIPTVATDHELHKPLDVKGQKLLSYKIHGRD